MGLFSVSPTPAMAKTFVFDNIIYPTDCQDLEKRQKNITYVIGRFTTYIEEELRLTAQMRQSVELSFVHQLSIINLRYLCMAHTYSEFLSIFRPDRVSKAADRFYDVIQYIDMTVDQDWRIYNTGQFIRSMLSLTTDADQRDAWKLPLKTVPWIPYLVYYQQAAEQSAVYQAACRARRHEDRTYAFTDKETQESIPRRIPGVAPPPPPRR